MVVFIDHSNVHHRLCDSGWNLTNKDYNPLVLAQRLAGNRNLVGVMFYCSAPLQDIQITRPESYAAQMKYYSEVEKLDGVEVKYANLHRSPSGVYYEKNLDTQMTTDILMRAFRNEYDTAIVVSNDGDFADAVKSVKELGKRTEVAYFKNALSFNLRKNADLVRKMRPSYFSDIYNSQTSLFSSNENSETS